MHYADAALVTASASHINGEYTSATLSLQGGATLTPKGGALHRVSRTGSTRLLIDTDGIANIPVITTVVARVSILIDYLKMSKHYAQFSN